MQLYNDPLQPRALEGFVVHMHLAWLYLLHALFIRDGVDIRYRDPSRPGRFEKVDGEDKTWELATCARHRWSERDPVRLNLEFFIRFRNKIEHRHKGTDRNWLNTIGDKSHALLVNFENEIVGDFGNMYTLADKLRFPVFVGTFTEPADEALRRFRRSIPADLRNFLAEYDAGIDPSIREDSRYAIRLSVQLRTTTASNPDMAIQFVREEELTDDEASELQSAARSGRVIVRQQERPVSNLNLFKPKQVVALVAAAIPFRFTIHDFQQAWRLGEVRPTRNAPDPKRTRTDFCIYDQMHRDYGYSQAYVDYLIRKCASEAGFREVTGRDPRTI